MLGPKSILCVLCQVPPGFTRGLALDPARLYYQVETLVFGRAAGTLRVRCRGGYLRDRVGVGSFTLVVFGSSIGVRSLCRPLVIDEEARIQRSWNDLIGPLGLLEIEESKQLGVGALIREANPPQQ